MKQQSEDEQRKQEEIDQRRREESRRLMLSWNKKNMAVGREFLRAKAERFAQAWEKNKNLSTDELAAQDLPSWTDEEFLAALDEGAGEIPRRALDHLERAQRMRILTYLIGQFVTDCGRAIEAVGNGTYAFADAADLRQLNVVLARESQRLTSIEAHVEDVREREALLAQHPERTHAENVEEAKRRIRERRAAG